LNVFFTSVEVARGEGPRRNDWEMVGRRVTGDMNHSD